MFKKIFFNSKGPYIAAIIFGTIIFILNNCFQEGNWSNLINYVDGLFIGGISNVLLGGLAWVSNQGTFDIFTFIFRKNKENTPNLYEYTVSKREKRNKNRFDFVAYIVVGILMISISLLLYTCFIVK